MEIEFARHFLSYEGKTVDRRLQDYGKVTFENGNYYEGHLEASKMNGKGALRWMDGVVYRGNFDHNIITGQGTYAWPDGSTYTGAVVNGKREGHGTWTKGKVHYEGEWHAGLKHGKGICYYDAERKSYYDGDWVRGQRHGWGVMVYESGNRYEGEWENNVKSGEGQMVWLVEPASQPELEFNCTLRSTALTGTVPSASQPPTAEDLEAVSQELGPRVRYERYTGTWKVGQPDGYGVYEWLSLPRDAPMGRAGNQETPYQAENVYKGLFRAGRKHGLGLCFYADGSVFEGTWVDDKKHGEGLRRYIDGSTESVLFDMDMLQSVVPLEPAAAAAMAPDKWAIPRPPGTPEPGQGASLMTIDSLPVDLAPFVATDQEAQEVKFLLQRMFAHLRYLYKFYAKLYEPPLPQPGEVQLQRSVPPPVLPPGSSLQSPTLLLAAGPVVRSPTAFPTSPAAPARPGPLPTPPATAKCLTLGQFWELLRDARVTGRDFPLALVDRVIQPALMRQTYRKDDDPKEHILRLAHGRQEEEAKAPPKEEPAPTPEAHAPQPPESPKLAKAQTAAALRVKLQPDPRPAAITLLKVKSSSDIRKASEESSASVTSPSNTLWERRLSRSPKSVEADLQRLKQVKLLDDKPTEERRKTSRERRPSPDSGDPAKPAPRQPKPKASKGKAAKAGKAADNKDGGPPRPAHTPQRALAQSILGSSTSPPALHSGTTQLLFPTFVECLLRVAEFKFRFTGGHIWEADAAQTSMLKTLQTLFETHLCFLTDCLKQLARANLPGLPPFTGEPLPNLTFEAPRTKASKRRLRRPDSHDANAGLDSPMSQGSSSPLGSSAAAFRKRASAAAFPASRRSTAAPPISPASSVARAHALGSFPSRIAGLSPLNLGRARADSSGRARANTGSRSIAPNSARSVYPEGPHTDGTGVSTIAVPLYDVSRDEPLLSLDVVEVTAPIPGATGATDTSGAAPTATQRLYGQHVVEDGNTQMTFLGVELQRKAGTRPPAVRQRMKAVPVVRTLQQRSNVLLLVWHNYQSPRHPGCMSLRYFMKFLADYQLLPTDDPSDDALRGPRRKSQVSNRRKSGNNAPHATSYKVASGPGQPPSLGHAEPPPPELLQRRPRVSRLVARLVAELFEEDAAERIAANPDYSDCPPALEPFPVPAPAAATAGPAGNHEAVRDAMTSAGGTSCDLASVISHDFYEDRPMTTTGPKAVEDPKRSSVVERATSNDGEPPAAHVKCLSFWIEPDVESVAKPSPTAVKQAWLTASRLEKVCWTWDYVYGDLEMLYPQFLEAICIVAEASFPRPDPAELPPEAGQGGHGPKAPPPLEASDVFGLRNRLNDLLDWLESPPPLPRPRTPSPPPLRLPPPLPRRKPPPPEAEPSKGKGRVAIKSAAGKPPVPKKK